MNPAELYWQLNDCDDLILAARRALVSISHEYARLDPAVLCCDLRASPIEPAEAVSATRPGLRHALQALSDASELLDGARQPASRIAVRT